MPDQKSGAVEEKAVETETTQTSPPQVEEPTTETQTTRDEVVDQSSSTESTDDSPVGSENWTAEQRRAFQEQRQEIKRLKEQVSKREESESAFNAFRQPTPPVSQVGPVRVETYTDEYGVTNWTAYNQATAQREQQVLQQARFEAQQTTTELVDENNARNKYPELFNDRDIEQEIADRWFAAKMRGENPSIAQIAERIAKREGKTASKAEKIGREKALDEVSEKEQAGLVASGQTSTGSQQVVSEGEQTELVDKTRHGSDDAIAARISKIPWANK